MKNKQVCTCPTARFYYHNEICEYCRNVAFHDDPDYAELMGFVLVDGKWVRS